MKILKKINIPENSLNSKLKKYGEILVKNKNLLEEYFPISNTFQPEPIYLDNSINTEFQRLSKVPDADALPFNEALDISIGWANRLSFIIEKNKSNMGNKTLVRWLLQTKEITEYVVKLLPKN